MTTNSISFLGLDEESFNNHDWEKDSMYDTYGLYD